MHIVTVHVPQYSPVSTIADCQNLQEDLDRLVQWAKTWQMNFNLTKCEMIQITNRIYQSAIHTKCKTIV